MISSKIVFLIVAYCQIDYIYYWAKFINNLIECWVDCRLFSNISWLTGFYFTHWLSPLNRFKRITELIDNWIIIFFISKYLQMDFSYSCAVIKFDWIFQKCLAPLNREFELIADWLQWDKSYWKRLNFKQSYLWLQTFRLLWLLSNLIFILFSMVSERKLKCCWMIFKNWSIEQFSSNVLDNIL